MSCLDCRFDSVEADPLSLNGAVRADHHAGGAKAADRLLNSARIASSVR